jgi:hypothetical protein
MPLLVWDSQVPSIRLSLLRSPTKFHVNVEASIENATVVADGRVPVTAPPKFCMPPPEIPYRRVNVPREDRREHDVRRLRLPEHRPPLHARE